MSGKKQYMSKSLLGVSRARPQQNGENLISLSPVNGSFPAWCSFQNSDSVQTALHRSPLALNIHFKHVSANEDLLLPTLLELQAHILRQCVDNVYCLYSSFHFHSPVGCFFSAVDIVIMQILNMTDVVVAKVWASKINRAMSLRWIWRVHYVWQGILIRMVPVKQTLSPFPAL